MARHGQINSKVYMRNIFKRQMWSSFHCMLNPHEQRLYEINVISLSHCFDQSVYIFRRSCWLVFLWFLKLICIIFRSRKWLILVGISLACIWAKWPQNRAYCKLFRKFCYFFPLKTVWKENCCGTCLSTFTVDQLISSKFFVGAGFFSFVLFFLMKLHYLTFKKWQANFSENYSFACIWTKRVPK